MIGTNVHNLADIALGAAKGLGQLLLQRCHLFLKVVALPVELANGFVLGDAAAHKVYVFHIFVKEGL